LKNEDGFCGLFSSTGEGITASDSDGVETGGDFRFCNLKKPDKLSANVEVSADSTAGGSEGIVMGLISLGDLRLGFSTESRLVNKFETNGTLVFSDDPKLSNSFGLEGVDEEDND